MSTSKSGGGGHPIKGIITQLWVGREIWQRRIAAIGLTRSDEIEFSLIEKQFVFRFCQHPLFEIRAMVGLIAGHLFRWIATPLLTI